MGDLPRNEIEQASNTQLTSSTTTANSTPNGKRQRHDLSINQGKVVYNMEHAKARVYLEGYHFFYDNCIEKYPALMQVLV